MNVSLWLVKRGMSLPAPLGGAPLGAVPLPSEAAGERRFLENTSDALDELEGVVPCDHDLSVLVQLDWGNISEERKPEVEYSTDGWVTSVPMTRARVPEPAQPLMVAAAAAETAGAAEAKEKKADETPPVCTWVCLPPPPEQRVAAGTLPAFGFLAAEIPLLGSEVGQLQIEFRLRAIGQLGEIEDYESDPPAPTVFLVREPIPILVRVRRLSADCSLQCGACGGARSALSSLCSLRVGIYTHDTHLPTHVCVTPAPAWCLQPTENAGWAPHHQRR